MKEMLDVLRVLPTTEKYKYLKDSVINHFADSQDQWLQKLLSAASNGMSQALTSAATHEDFRRQPGDGRAPQDQVAERAARVGTQHPVHPDALSRSCVPSGLLAADIQAAQQQDVELSHVLEKNLLDLQQLTIDGANIACGMSDGIVKPYLPDALRRQAFHAIHSIAHSSPRATVKLLAQKFTWPGIKKDAYHWARSCEPWQRAKVGRHNRAALSSFDVPDNRFEHLHLCSIS